MGNHLDSVKSKQEPGDGGQPAGASPRMNKGKTKAVQQNQWKTLQNLRFLQGARRIPATKTIEMDSEQRVSIRGQLRILCRFPATK